MSLKVGDDDATSKEEVSDSEAVDDDALQITLAPATSFLSNEEDVELLDLIAAVQLKVEARKDRNLENISRGPRCYNQADVAIYVILALNDATKICNALIDMVASTMESTENVILYVRQERSIFSNRCDHAVVCNSASNAPVFCVDTKYRFDETFH